MIFNVKSKDFKPSTFREYVMNDEEIVEQPLERDLDDRSNDEKKYTCEGCGTTFPTGIARATHCRNCTSSIAWKAEQGEPTSREREDVEREDESIYRGEGGSNEILRQILTEFPGVCARNVISFDVNCAHARATKRAIIQVIVSGKHASSIGDHRPSGEWYSTAISRSPARARMIRGSSLITN